MKLYERFLITLEERDLDPSELLFFKGIEGFLYEFEKWLYAFGHIEEPKASKKFKLVEIKENGNG